MCQFFIHIKGYLTCPSPLQVQCISDLLWSSWKIGHFSPMQKWPKQNWSRGNVRKGDICISGGYNPPRFLSFGLCCRHSTWLQRVGVKLQTRTSMLGQPVSRDAGSCTCARLKKSHSYMASLLYGLWHDTTPNKWKECILIFKKKSSYFQFKSLFSTVVITMGISGQFYLIKFSVNVI